MLTMVEHTRSQSKMSCTSAAIVTLRTPVCLLRYAEKFYKHTHTHMNTAKALLYAP